MSVHLQPYWSFKDELLIGGSLVPKGGIIIIPKCMGQKILTGIHASHLGIEKCILRAKTCVYWLGINDVIESVVKDTRGCKRRRL